MKKTKRETHGKKNWKSSPSLKRQEPIHGLMSLAGIFKVNEPLDPIKVREYMEKNYKRI